MLARFSSLPVRSARRFISYSHVNLSGHNKWSKIKDRKGATDAAKSVAYGNAAKEITSAVRAGGSPDPTKNLQLATAIKRAKDASVPRENIEKAIARASGVGAEGSKTTYEAMFGTIGLIIECETDNVNRTNHNVKNILSKHGAHTTPVKFMFQKAGILAFAPRESADADKIEELLLLSADHGAEDFYEREEDGKKEWVFTTQPTELSALSEALRKAGGEEWNLSEYDTRWIPVKEDGVDNTATEELEKSLQTLVEDLEANEDVRNVTTSLDHAQS